MPEVQRMLLAEGGEIAPGTPEEFAAFLRSEVLKWATVVKQARITAD
jgi:tripartite-type tricarboxylate transporter receptor subunit TctC